MMFGFFCSSFEKEVYDEWVAGVDEACSFNLNQSLINRNDEKLISVNFDPQVMIIGCKKRMEGCA